MESIMATRGEAPSGRLIAPLWHTVLLVALFLGMAVAGAVFQGTAQSRSGTLRHSSALPLYLSILAGEWALVLFVGRAGLRRAGLRMRDLLGGAWRRPLDCARDLVLAAALWGAWKLVQVAWDALFGSGQAASISPLLPRTFLEIVVWVAVSISAGFCEEVVFRGYLLRQFSALTGSRIAGLLLQAALFGIAHGYQGAAACGRIAAFGLIFGVVALRLGSLRPGIAAHAGSDIIAGIFRI